MVVVLCGAGRMELSGVYFLVSISIVSVLVKEFTTVSEARVGLAMVYTLQLTGGETRLDWAGQG